MEKGALRCAAEPDRLTGSGVGFCIAKGVSTNPNLCQLHHNVNVRLLHSPMQSYAKFLPVQMRVQPPAAKLAVHAKFRRNSTKFGKDNVSVPARPQ